MPPSVADTVECHGAHPGLGVGDARQLGLLAQRGDEGVLDGVLCFGEIAADGVELDDQAAVRRVVQLVEVDCSRHRPPPPAVPASPIVSAVVDGTIRRQAERFPVTLARAGLASRERAAPRAHSAPPKPGQALRISTDGWNSQATPGTDGTRRASSHKAPLLRETTMARHSARCLLLLAAALSLQLTGCSDDSPHATEKVTNSPSTTGSADSGPSASERASSAPFSLREYAGPIDPGLHRLPLISWERSYPVDALVRVPPGFITPG